MTRKLIGVTLVEMVTLGALASGLALAGNALRQDHLQLTRNYFEKPKVNLPPPATTPPAVDSLDGRKAADAGDSNPAPEDANPVGHPGDTTDSAPAPPAPGSAPPSEKPTNGNHDWQEQPRVNPEHGLLTIGFQQALKIYQDPMYLDGLCIFVDARRGAAYAEGHVPGAYQIDHYHLERYLDEVLPAAQRAERIVLYCEGGRLRGQHLRRQRPARAGHRV